MKKLFLLEPFGSLSYGDYDGAVVCALNENDAKNINPDGEIYGEVENYIFTSSWELPMEICAKFIGIADDNIPLNSVVLASNVGS